MHKLTAKQKPTDGDMRTVNVHLPKLIDLEYNLHLKTMKESLNQILSKMDSEQDSSIKKLKLRIDKLKKKIYMLEKVNMKALKTKRLELKIKRENIGRLSHCIEINEASLEELHRENQILSKKMRKRKEDPNDYEQMLKDEEQSFLQKYEELHLQYSKNLNQKNLENFDRYKFKKL